LLAQGEVLEGEVTVAAAEDREESEKVEQRVIIELGSSPDQA
jgi:hypothetical protein